jgi:hypothetical protein
LSIPQMNLRKLRSLALKHSLYHSFVRRWSSLILIHHLSMTQNDLLLPSPAAWPHAHTGFDVNDPFADGIAAYLNLLSHADK